MTNSDLNPKDRATLEMLTTAIGECYDIATGSEDAIHMNDYQQQAAYAHKLLMEVRAALLDPPEAERVERGVPTEPSVSGRTNHPPPAPSLNRLSADIRMLLETGHDPEAILKSVLERLESEAESQEPTAKEQWQEADREFWGPVHKLREEDEARAAAQEERLARIERDGPHFKAQEHPESEGEECPECYGSGSVLVDCDTFGIDCACNGPHAECETCNGTGQKETPP